MDYLRLGSELMGEYCSFGPPLQLGESGGLLLAHFGTVRPPVIDGERERHSPVTPFLDVWIEGLPHGYTGAKMKDETMKNNCND